MASAVALRRLSLAIEGLNADSARVEEEHELPHFISGMPTSNDDITADQWPLIKSLWYAVQDAAPAQRGAILDDPRVALTVRHHVRRLLTASAGMGDRFETSALSVLDPADPADLAPASMVGRRLGAYDVVRRIGQGGMGAVYEAVRADDAYRQRVAIKTIWRGADSAVLLQRFRSERQILAGLQHPNIAGLLDGGATAEGTPWLAMEYVDGVPIDTYCDRAALSLPARLDLFLQICAAVHFAHRNLVVHRDIKPSNVLVTPDGTVKLLDFGVAKLLDDPRSEGTLTGAGLSPYTASYASPEQVSGSAISIATDVYSLGALLVTLLAGRPPLDAGAMTQVEVIDAIRNLPSPAPSDLARRARGAVVRNAGAPDVGVHDAGAPNMGASDAGAPNVDAPDTNAIARARGFPTVQRLARALTGELDAIALMALRKEPERRYSGADALAEDLRRYLRRDRVLARPDTVGYRMRSFLRRQRPFVVASAAIMLVTVGAVVTASWQGRRTTNQTQRAEARLREVRTLATALLYDANDQLADVPGAMGARVALVRTALHALDRASLDAPRESALLRELAMAYARAGDVLGNPTQPSSGDLAGAADAYRKAIGFAELLRAQRPQDAASAWTLALVYEKAADVEAPIGEVSKAYAHQRASLALFRQISAADTTQYGAIRAVGISALKTGDLLGHPSFTNVGDTSAAIAAYTEAVAWLERARVHGDTTHLSRRHRAVASERLGRLMQERHDFGAATQWLDASLLLRDSLMMESPRSVLARRDVAIAHYLLCGMHLANARADLALPECEQSLRIRQMLLAEDPVNLTLQRGMGIIHGRLGEVYARRGEPERALSAYARSADYYETFFGGRTGAINDRRDLALIQLQRGELAATRTVPGSNRIAATAYAATIASLDSIARRTPLTLKDSVQRATALDALARLNRRAAPARSRLH